ncbi:hypothetical protein F7725_005567 [Dissostichus mawsoni]|uniref:AB hydrolase-1 domain-containing protein n=1 Tax=Dissostichus mawsoni TaxID=36200 RepID=A0A7J5YRL6_DISMA|nr:hypothetical protein F7725_005567 [Dissostichus mawsoni]
MLQALKGVRHLHTSAMKQAELCVPVPWGEIRGKVWGPDHGRPVLCLHGWADNCGTFNTLIPHLPKECRYVAVELAGHGRSSHRPAGVSYSFPTYVMDVRRVVDGGNIAGMFSALYPEMVDAVVLLDSYGFFPTDLKEVFEAMRQGMDQMVEFEKKTEEKKTRVYTYEDAVERCCTFLYVVLGLLHTNSSMLQAANPTLSEKSAHILLERGLVQVEGGVVFTRDFRINLKNMTRITAEQSLELQSMIKAPVLVVLAEDGFEKLFVEPDKRRFTSAMLQAYRDRNHTVVKVPGDHHIHLNDPGVVAPLVSDFLRSKVLSEPATLKEEQTSNSVSRCHGGKSEGEFGVLNMVVLCSACTAGLTTVYVTDVLRVTDALQLRKFSVIGHSMGGDVAGMKEICKVARQGMDQILQFEKKTEEEKRRVYTYEKAVERLLAANPTLSERSVHILLERGLVQVEGGFVFSRDLRKNIVRISLEQSLEIQSRIQASVLAVLTDKGFDKILSEPAQRKFTSALLEGLKNRNKFHIPLCFCGFQHTVVRVPGDHHVHLNNPEVIAPFVSDFLRTKSSLSQCHGGKSEGELGVLNMVVLCFACTAGLTTVAHLTPSSPFYPKSAEYVAVDLAGHGLSSHRPAGVLYTFPANVADVRRIVDGLQWTTFTIIGHSMGGNIAALFSALYPEMVDAFILLDAYGFLPTDQKEIPKVMRQGMDEMLQYEKKTEEKKRVYTYEKAAERLQAANPTLSERSVHTLLERGLVQGEGGFEFSRDLRINFVSHFTPPNPSPHIPLLLSVDLYFLQQRFSIQLKNIVRISLEQSLEIQSRIQASVLVVLGDKGFGATTGPELYPRRFASKLLQGYHDRNHTVVTVAGDHHVHLNDPEVVAPLVSDFLRTKVFSQHLPA